LATSYSLFIDGQNVPSRYIDPIVQYCESLGHPQKEARLYASTGEIAGIMANWSTILADYDIDPVPVRCKPRKNSVDIKIAVDVIDSACREKANDIVVVVTNDSDFTHIASKVISYKAEFHLLYTDDNQPSDYSLKTVMHRLPDTRGKRKRIAEGVREAAAHLPGARSMKTALRTIAAPFVPKQDYSSKTPIAQLNLTNFARRLLETSPVALDARNLFAAYKDHSGRRWKAESSKKTAQAFFDELFAPESYAFRQWTGRTSGEGVFVNPKAGRFEAENGRAIPVVSLIGASPDLLAAQAEIIADSLRSTSFGTPDELYDDARERNILPRYGAAILIKCWSARSAGPAPGEGPKYPRDETIDARQIVQDYHAELRERIAAGEVVLGSPESDLEAA
jgi:hypothetical protein